MKSPLIIVESPSKIKTLKKFLDENYNIEASVGHFRDLPKSKLGIEVDDNFSAEYHVSQDSTKTVQALKKALKQSDALFIATDPAGRWRGVGDNATCGCRHWHHIWFHLWRQ